jgi:low affinity Fe/Cu permease
MKKSKNDPFDLEKISSRATKASGSPAAFIIAFLIIVAWLLSGPIFNFSDTWQLVINTGTTIITFLMVFLIQRSQNKDSLALHLKLNELIAAQEHASNRLIAVEEISEDELKVLQKFYQHLASMSENDLSVEESHSIQEANLLHHRKNSSTSRKKKSGI